MVAAYFITSVVTGADWDFIVSPLRLVITVYDLFPLPLFRPSNLAHKMLVADDTIDSDPAPGTFTTITFTVIPGTSTRPYGMQVCSNRLLLVILSGKI